MMRSDEIAEMVRGSVGRQLQEPKTGVIETIGESVDPYTVTVNVNGQVESVQAKFDPSMYDKIYVGLPVQLVVNEDNELEIIGSNPTASREAWAGEYPETAIVGLVDLDQGGTNADLSNADDGAVIKNGTSMATLKHNLNASTAPASGDDSGDGYAVGSLWCDTTNDVFYICVDASAGAAVWSSGGVASPVSVADGGTGRTSVTANSLLIGNGTSALNIVTPAVTSSVPTYTGGGWAISNSPTLGSVTLLGGATINENGLSTGDLRAESDTNTHQLFLDASLDALGINESAPDANSALTITADANDAPLQLTPAATPTNLSNGQVWQDSDRNTIGTRIGGATLNVPVVIFSMYGTDTVTAASYTDVSNGTAIGSTTLPANFLKPGKVIQAKILASISSPSSGITMDVRSQLQSTASMTLTGFTLNASRAYYLEWDVWYICVATGATSTVRGHTHLMITDDTGGKNTQIEQIDVGLSNVNTASTAVFLPEMQLSSALAGCTITVYSIIIEALN